MTQSFGKCANCNQDSPYTNVNCDYCGSRLPWAAAVSGQRAQTQPLQSDPVLPSLPTPAPVGASSVAAATTKANNSTENIKATIGCFLMLIFVVPLSCSLFRGDGKKGDTYAYVLARHSIEQQLKAPSTAKFPHSYDPGVRVLQKGDTFYISSYVDSQNSFGAMIRTKWVAQVQRTPDGKEMNLVAAGLVP